MGQHLQFLVFLQPMPVVAEVEQIIKLPDNQRRLDLVVQAAAVPVDLIR
jgi:hypothetical protein